MAASPPISDPIPEALASVGLHCKVRSSGCNNAFHVSACYCLERKQNKSNSSGCCILSGCLQKSSPFLFVAVSSKAVVGVVVESYS